MHAASSSNTSPRWTESLEHSSIAVEERTRLSTAALQQHCQLNPSSPNNATSTAHGIGMTEALMPAPYASAQQAVASMAELDRCLLRMLVLPLVLNALIAGSAASCRIDLFNCNRSSHSQCMAAQSVGVHRVDQLCHSHRLELSDRPGK